jgi:hypothetical protein
MLLKLIVFPIYTNSNAYPNKITNNFAQKKKSAGQFKYGEAVIEESVVMPVCFSLILWKVPHIADAVMYWSRSSPKPIAKKSAGHNNPVGRE